MHEEIVKNNYNWLFIIIYVHHCVSFRARDQFKEIFTSKTSTTHITCSGTRIGQFWHTNLQFQFLIDFVNVLVNFVNIR